MSRRKPQKDTTSFVDMGGKRVFCFRPKRPLTQQERDKAIADLSRHELGKEIADVQGQPFAVIWVRTDGLGEGL